MMKYYIDSNGNYLGGSDNSALSRIEVATAPNDAREIWDGVKWNKPIPTKQEVIDSISEALQDVLNIEAIKLGYDNINTASSYAEEVAIAKFSTDGKSFRKWRSLVWDYAYNALNKYDADTTQYATDKAQYDTDKAQYDIDYAQWLIDVVADATLVEPIQPTPPTIVVQPTKRSMLTNMPARV